MRVNSGYISYYINIWRYYCEFKSHESKGKNTHITPLPVDFTSGDVITPKEVKYIFTGIFDKSKQIELWLYNIETILAEKVETILRRGVFNTRSRDFYDVYILSKTQKFDIDICVKFSYEVNNY